MSTILKRATIILAVIIACINQAKALSPGEVIDYDGMKCIVLGLSADTAQHQALIVAPPAQDYDGKNTPTEFALSNGKDGEFMLQCLTKGGLRLFVEPKTDKKLTKKYTTEAMKLMTHPQGYLNQKALHDFCESQGIAMADYFPAYAWAESLGEGWYIGGYNELYAYGAWANTTGAGLILERDRPTRMYSLNEYPLKGLSKGEFFFPTYVMCSTTAFKYGDKNKPTHQALLLLGRLNQYGNIYLTSFDIRTYTGGISKYDLGRDESRWGKEVTVQRWPTWMHRAKWLAFKWIPY